MKKYLNEEKLYFFKKCKWTLEKKSGKQRNKHRFVSR